MNPIRVLGRTTVASIIGMGRIARFAADIALKLLRPPMRIGRTVDAIYDLGFLSLLLIATSGFAVGAVLGLQGYTPLVICLGLILQRLRQSLVDIEGHPAHDRPLHMPASLLWRASLVPGVTSPSTDQ